MTGYFHWGGGLFYVPKGKELIAMVDTTEAMESKYLTAELVKNAESKVITFISDGKYEDTEWGSRLTITVKIDGKEKIWRPNRDSVKNLQQLGKDSTEWFGKKAKLQIVVIQGKDSIIAVPLLEDGNKDNQN